MGRLPRASKTSANKRIQTDGLGIFVGKKPKKPRKRPPPYGCTLCHKRFHRKTDMVTHMAGPWFCYVCGRMFMYCGGLRNHKMRNTCRQSGIQEKRYNLNKLFYNYFGAISDELWRMGFFFYAFKFLPILYTDIYIYIYVCWFFSRINVIYVYNIQWCNFYLNYSAFLVKRIKNQLHVIEYRFVTLDFINTINCK